MMDPASRPPRKVAIADHIWQAFEDMASQMGSDRDALINQAMFMFARLNGFLEGAGGGGSARPSNGTPPRAPQRPAAGAAPPQLKPVQQPQGSLDDDPVRRQVQEKVLETAAELERLIKSKNQGGQPPPEADGGGDEGFDNEVDVDVGASDASGAPALYMMLEGGELDRIAKERFVIGRGKHCDFVINSGKVSREHAVIVRDGGEYFIEDLGSSNGTWFNKQRIKRRKVEDGDEYFICSEKVKFVYR
ncbi:MAG: FHA domain-containing protein [Myxococcota bacterium]